MRHPLQQLPEGERLRAFVPLLALTLGVMTVLNFVDLPLRNVAAPWGVVSFEFAGSVEKARAILDSWDGTARMRATFGLGFDHLFIFAYSLTIALGCVGTSGLLRKHRPVIARAGLPLAWGAWMAGVLDMTENASLFTMLLNNPTSPWPQVAWWAAAVKFLLVLAGIVYMVLGAALGLLRTTEWR